MICCVLHVICFLPIACCGMLELKRLFALYPSDSGLPQGKITLMNFHPSEQWLLGVVIPGLIDLIRVC